MSEKQQMAIDTGKAVSAWTFAGLTASEIASILAAAYTCLLIGEWFWRKLIKGWLHKPKQRDEHEGAGV